LGQGLQVNPNEEPNRIGGPKIERSLPDSVDRFFEQPEHVINTLQRDGWEFASVRRPAAILLPSLPAELRQFLGRRVKKAQASLH
jgi:hypothetical protein